MILKFKRNIFSANEVICHPTEIPTTFNLEKFSTKLAEVETRKQKLHQVEKKIENILRTRCFIRDPRNILLTLHQLKESIKELKTHLANIDATLADKLYLPLLKKIEQLKIKIKSLWAEPEILKLSYSTTCEPSYDETAAAAAASASDSPEAIDPVTVDSITSISVVTDTDPFEDTPVKTVPIITISLDKNGLSMYTSPHYFSI